MFQLTGSLVGPVVTHAVVNGLNLAYLKHHDPKPPPRVLGDCSARTAEPPERPSQSETKRARAGASRPRLSSATMNTS